MRLTRFDPGLPLHRLRLSGDLAEIGAADLAFDADAVTGLANNTESLDLSPRQVNLVLARTQGKTQLKHLFRKLDVTNRRDAVRRGRELGLIA